MSVTIQQAAANAFASWLATELGDIPVEPRWPSPDKQKPPKSISVITAGRRRDTPIDLRILKQTNLGSKQTTAIWQLAACTQPFQLDVWALNDIARDDILARLDAALHKGSGSLTGAVMPMPVGNGNLIKLADGWDACGSIADFVFEDPDTETTSDTAGRSLYRATFRGNAYFMLTVTTVTARQVAINFKLRLSETDTPEDFSVTPVTAP